MNLQRFRTIAAISVLLVLAGCALSDPYVRPSSANESYLAACKETCTIDQAQQYSRVVREAYRERLSAYAKLRYNSGATNIVLGAIGLGLAQGGAHVDNLIALGLIGGTNFGLTSWYGSEPLEALYASAYVALVCAENAVEPLRIAPPLESRLTSAIEEFDRAHAPALQALIEFHAVAAEARSSSQSPLTVPPTVRGQAADLRTDAALSNAIMVSLAARAERELALAQSRFSALQVTYARATQLQQASGTAGNRLVRVVDSVVATVNKQLQASLPDPNASQSIIANLGALASKVVPGLELRSFAMPDQQPPTGKQSATVDARVRLQANREFEQRFNRASAQLNDKLAVLEAASFRMNAVVQSVPVEDIAAALSLCNVEASAPLSALPPTLHLSGSSLSLRFIVSGGKGPYSGVVFGEQLEGLVIENPIAGDRGFQILRTAKTPSGSTRLLISDAAGNILEIPVTVSAAQTAPEVTPNPPPAANAVGLVNPPQQPTSTNAPLAGIDDFITTIRTLFVGKRLTEIEGTVGHAFKVGSIDLDRDARSIRIRLDPTPADTLVLAALRQLVLDRRFEGGESVGQALTRQGLTLNLG